MKSSIRGVNNLGTCLAAGIFTVSLAGSTLAQAPAGPPPGAGPPANNNPSLEDRVRHVNEDRLRTTEMESALEAENQKRVHAAVVNVKEDFTRIQVLRNDIARNLVARKPLDYSLVSDQTKEINKRAKELKIYMMVRVTEDKKQNDPADLKSDDMISVLVILCKLIDSFTENPALKNVATVNVKEVEKAKEDKAKADTDLLAIIRLSASIQKKSESLKVPK